MSAKNLCMGCMSELNIEDVEVCPKCGYRLKDENPSRGLQPRTILNEKYLVGKVIGEGGFGITYIGYDLILNSRIAIKEYFPVELATRDTTVGAQTSLTVLTGSKEEQYKKGIDRFVNEASNLAKFNDLSGIVSVRDFFYENNTAYMVMEYIDGMTLTEYLKQNGDMLPYNTVLEMMKPVMDSLQKVHEAGIIHRDISPDNIMVTKTGEVKLIDFGAARIVGNEDQKSLTVILKHGYAPQEQYQTNGKQGPWTDVYALAATMYRMITGIVPQESTERILSGDTVAPVNKLIADVPKNVSETIRHGMAVNATSRCSSVEMFSAELSGKKVRKNTWVISIVAVVAVLIVCIICLCLAGKGKDTNHIEDISKMTDSVLEKELDDVTEDVEDMDGDLLDDNSKLADEENKKLPPEYLAYKEYFFSNYDTSEDKDYYVYFFDVEHSGIDNMIIVEPVVDQEYYWSNRYCVDVLSYVDGKVECIYRKHFAERYIDNSKNDGSIDEDARGNMWVVFSGDECYLCTEENEIELHEDVDYMGNPMTTYSVLNYNYRIFSLEHSGDEKTKEIIPKEEYIDNMLKDDILPSYLQYGFRLGSSNSAWSDGMGGISMCYNHEYRNVLINDAYWDIKSYDNKAYEISQSEELKLTDIAFEDFDGDGDMEIVEGLCNIDKEGPEYSGIGNDYNVFVIDEERRDIVDHFWDGESPLNILVCKFGKSYGILSGRTGSMQSNNYHTNLIAYSETKGYSALVSYDNEYGIGYDDSMMLDISKNGEVYVLSQGEMYDHTSAIEWDKDSKFYLSYLNDEFIEYDSVEISLDDLNHLDNVDEAIKDAGKHFYEYGDYYSDFGWQIMNILYSSNDMIYINYFLSVFDQMEGQEYGDYYAVVFKIVDNKLEYVDMELGKRPFTSGEDIKSYKVNFEYGNFETSDLGELKDEDIDEDIDVLYTGVVQASDGFVNFRKGPGKEFEIMEEIYDGEILNVIGENDNGKWLQISRFGTIGWVAASEVVLNDGEF